MMAGDFGADSDDFVVRLSDAFQRSVFQPMFQKAPLAPGDVRDLIAELRDKLDLLDRVIAMAEQGKAGASSGRAAAIVAAEPRSSCEDSEIVSDGIDDIGRNQRSRVRELHLLDAMARETRAYSLQQLISALAQKGFSDSSGAVVSQLHRLKKLGLVNQPASGMYEITTDGLGHQRKLRSSFGALAGDAR
jgi:hypothetical protein